MSTDNLYRVIKPYDSNLLHSSKSLIGGASKCYKEVKKVSPTTSGFSVMHMKTNEIYDFNINNIKQMGGGYNNEIGGTNASLSDLEILKNQMSSMEKRIIAIENKLNIANVNDNMNDNVNDNMNDNMNNNMNDNMNDNMNNNISPKPTNLTNLTNQMQPNMMPSMRPNMGQNMMPSMRPTMGQNMMPSMRPTMGQNMGQSNITGGFENQNTKASAFYSAARDFV